MRFVRTVENLFGLPAGFQRTEYLESTGTQYIDTGIPLSNENTVKTKIRILKVNNSFFYGSRKSYMVDAFGLHRNYAPFGSDSGMNYVDLSAGTDYIVEQSQNGISINGELKKTYPVSTFTTPENCYLFYLRQEGGFYDSPSSARIYYFQVWDNGTLVRDFIPCLDASNVPCMYDLVGKKPYYNAGTGSFSVGRQVIPVEYLESSGTQYIDTGVRYNSSNYYKIENKIYYGSKNQQFQVQGWDAGGVNGMAGTGLFSDGSSIYGPSCENKSVITEQIINSGTNTQTVTNYNIEGTTGSLSRAHTNLPLYAANGGYGIFACYSQTSFTYNASCKVYYYRIYQNGTLVRDFIPCKDENNVGFMFDKVSGTCYLNAGTGDFIVGENKYTSKLRLIRDAIRIPDGYTRVEYLESTGTQWIDTGIGYTKSTKVESRFRKTSTVGIGNNLFGSGSSFGSSDDFSLWCEKNTGLAIHMPYPYVDSGYKMTSVSINNDVVFTADLEKRVFTLNDQSYTVGGTTTSGSNNHILLYTFGPGYSYTSYFIGRIYYWKQWDNGTLVRSFIPVRDENNVGYMYDEVTGQIFGNAGSGSFVVGNDLPTAKVRFIQDVIPSDYIPLKYLESTGTQWINTDYIPKTNDVYVRYKAKVNTTGENITFGIYPSGNITLNMNLYQSDLAYFRILGFNTSGGISVPNGVTVPHEYELSVNACKIDSQVVRTPSILGSFTNNTSKVVLFARGANAAGTTVDYPLRGRIYYFTIQEGTTLVRDFYPALRKSDNKPGMYDRITKQFFVNQGTGEFNYEI